MGVFGKIMDSLRLSDNEDDDYFLDDDYEDEKPEKKSFFGKKDKEMKVGTILLPRYHLVTNGGYSHRKRKITPRMSCRINTFSYRKQMEILNRP